MSVQHLTTYRDMASWELSDSFWERIKPLLLKPYPFGKVDTVGEL